MPEKPRRHVRCRVRGCINRKNAPPPKTTLFRSPKDIEMCVRSVHFGLVRVCEEMKLIETFLVFSSFKKWIQFTGDEELTEIPLYMLRKSVALCERHFDSSVIRGSVRRKAVSRTAVPTLSPAEPGPLSDYQIREWMAKEHFVRTWLSPEEYAKRVAAGTENVNPNPTSAQPAPGVPPPLSQLFDFNQAGNAVLELPLGKYLAVSIMRHSHLARRG